MKEKKPSLLALSKIPEAQEAASPDRPLCDKCGLWKETTRPFMNPPVHPSWTGKLLIVGEAPGADEERSGRFFVGRAGKLLETELATTALSPPQGSAEPDVEVWNAVRCRPKDNATPTMEQIRCCRPFLLHRIQTLNPQIVLAMGTSAAKSLTNNGDASVVKTRGRPLEVEK